MKDKILGTAQLGLAYGINNGVMLAENEVIQILNEACESGFTLLDSAGSYGRSLDLIGDWHRLNPSREKFLVDSKFLMGELTDAVVFEMIKTQCDRAGVKFLNTIYFHSYAEYRNNRSLVDRLNDSGGLVRSVGVSVYNESEVEFILNDELVQCVQLPYSIFHHSSSSRGLLAEICKVKRVNIRSIYLQGLLFVNDEKLVGKLEPFRAFITKLREIASEMGLSLRGLASQYIIDSPIGSGVIIGCDNSAQVREAGAIFKRSDIDWHSVLKSLPVINEELLNPGNWK